MVLAYSLNEGRPESKSNMGDKNGEKGKTKKEVERISFGCIVNRKGLSWIHAKSKARGRKEWRKIISFTPTVGKDKAELHR